MTGFGKATLEIENKKISIEIKALNCKQLDVFTKIPNVFKEKEIDLRNEIMKQLERGKIELFISSEFFGGENTSKFNNTAIEEYYKELSKITDKLNIGNSTDLLNIIMRLPDTVKVAHSELNEDEWTKIFNSLQEVINNVKKFRKQEGQVLEKDITSRISIIVKQLEKIEVFENKRIENLKQRMHQNLSQSFSDEQIDKNRFEQELLYYIEKIDITEEKVRLTNHCNYFLATCNEKESQGKKLGFIAQEIGREINTIGSKANDFEIQKIVVNMKDELEKIKEQLMNVL
ncbi:MAG: YicC family protein [Bacteroidetes bacterium GWA2_30_7]|nr:MAG: YicC family protein [Bacteroidetes bacterium GWA2_30_7]